MKVKGERKAKTWKMQQERTGAKPGQRQTQRPYSEGACVRNPGVIPAKRQVAEIWEKSRNVARLGWRKYRRVGSLTPMKSMADKAEVVPLTINIVIEGIVRLSLVALLLNDSGFLTTGRSCTLFFPFALALRMAQFSYVRAYDTSAPFWMIIAVET